MRMLFDTVNLQFCALNRPVGKSCTYWNESVITAS